MSSALLDLRLGSKECRMENPPVGVMPDSKESENFLSQDSRNWTKQTSKKNVYGTHYRIIFRSEIKKF